MRGLSGTHAFYDSDAESAPGNGVHLIGGHTMGLKVVCARTRSGFVVLASDASHTVTA